MTRRERRIVMTLLVAWEAAMVVAYDWRLRTIVMAVLTVAFVWWVSCKSVAREDAINARKAEES